MTVKRHDQCEVLLRDFCEDDLFHLHHWACSINSTDYMARYTPKPERCLMWFVIQVRGIDVGTLWLEQLPDPALVNLGILLNNSSIFGQGLGSKAISLVITRASSLAQLKTIRLHVRENNVRAIACYKRCGFYMTESFIREVGGKSYTVLTMERALRDEVKSIQS